MAISITSISFHDGATSSHFNMGTHGYSLPQGRGAVSVDFRITEADGRYVVLTEVLSATLPDYNTLVERAYQQLARRLARLGKLGEQLEANYSRKEEQRTA
jgi:hypothetical protein